MILDAIWANKILGNLAPVEVQRPGDLMMMAESKPVLPTPSVCVYVCVFVACVCDRTVECWEWKSLENSKWRSTKCRRGNRSRKKVVHKKLAVDLKEGMFAASGSFRQTLVGIRR